jgi:hypothetical protein
LTQIKATAWHQTMINARSEKRFERNRHEIQYQASHAQGGIMRTPTDTEHSGYGDEAGTAAARPPLASLASSRKGAETGVRWLLGAVGAASLMLVTPIVPTTSVAQEVDIVVVDVVVVAKGYRTSKLTGRDVVNDKKEEIGKIDDFIIGRDRVLFAILQVGGFLGIASHLVAVPYSSLDLESLPGQIVLKGASKPGLKKLPEFKYGK